MERIAMFLILVVVIIFASQTFGQSITVEEVIYPSDVIVLSVEDLRAIKKEATKYYLAKAFLIAQSSGDKETAAIIKTIIKNNIGWGEPFPLYEKDFDSIKDRDEEEIIKGENLAVNSYVYGLIKIKKNSIVKIAEEWNTSIERIIEGLREAIQGKIRAGKQLSGWLDPMEPQSEIKASIFVVYKERIFFIPVEKRREILTMTLPRNAILILNAGNPLTSWEVKGFSGVVRKTKGETLIVKLTESKEVLVQP